MSQCVRFERSHDILIDATPAIFIRSQGRDQNHWQIFQGFVLPELRRQFNPVHPGHFHIRNQQIKMLALEQRPSRQTIYRCFDAVAGIFQNPPQQSAGGHRIFRHQQTGSLGRRYRFAGQNATPVLIPTAHVPAGWDIALGNVNAHHYVPNLITTYDPVLATGRADGFGSVGNAYIRVDSFGRPLAPLPRLPVSPTLAYFGEVIN